jgi:hypothetical protein
MNCTYRLSLLFPSFLLQPFGFNHYAPLYILFDIMDIDIGTPEITRPASKCIAG